MDDSTFVTITPASIAIFQLQECCAQLAKVDAEPIRVLQAAKSLHGALLAALTAVLAGSSGIGAYSEKLRERWLEFHEKNREAVAVVALSNRVMNFDALLDQACKPGGVEWGTGPLTCTPADRELIDRLTFIRDDFEHPKPMLNAFEPAWVIEPFIIAARLTLDALSAVHHQLGEGELDQAHEMVASITDTSERYGRPRFP